MMQVQSGVLFLLVPCEREIALPDEGLGEDACDDVEVGDVCNPSVLQALLAGRAELPSHRSRFELRHPFPFPFPLPATGSSRCVTLT